MQLNIDEELYEKLSRRGERKGFDSAEEYSVFVLQTIIEELEESGADDEVQDRLEDLGYLG